MNEILKPAGEWIAQNVSLTVLIVIFILSIFFKIPKKEVNVLGWFVGWVGKSFTRELRNDIQGMKTDSNKQISDLRTDLDAFEERTNTSIAQMQSGTTQNCELLKTRLDAMEKSNDMQTVRQIKTHVLNFANSCMNGGRHTVKDFRNIIKENKEYEALVEKYGLVNDVYKDDFEYIMEVYHECKRTRSFLNDNGEPLEDDDE